MADATARALPSSVLLGYGDEIETFLRRSLDANRQSNQRARRAENGYLEISGIKL